MTIFPNTQTTWLRKLETLKESPKSKDIFVNKKCSAVPRHSLFTVHSMPPNTKRSYEQKKKQKQ